MLSSSSRRGRGGNDDWDFGRSSARVSSVASRLALLAGKGVAVAAGVAGTVAAAVIGACAAAAVAVWRVARALLERLGVVRPRPGPLSSRSSPLGSPLASAMVAGVMRMAMSLMAKAAEGHRRVVETVDRVAKGPAVASRLGAGAAVVGMSTRSADVGGARSSTAEAALRGPRGAGRLMLRFEGERCVEATLSVAGDAAVIEIDVESGCEKGGDGGSGSSPGDGGDTTTIDADFTVSDRWQPRR